LYVHLCHKASLGGGFNPFEKYESKWKSSPDRGEKKIFETTNQQLYIYAKKTTVSWNSSGIPTPNVMYIYICTVIRFFFAESNSVPCILSTHISRISS